MSARADESAPGAPAYQETPSGERRGADAAATETAVVALRGIRKRFGYREALRGVDLDLVRGDCAAVLGPNGAGKSTLLRIVATEWRPTGGNGTILGEDIRRPRPAVRRRIGVVYHQSFLRGELTLDENLRFYGGLYGLEPAAQEARAARLVERLGLQTRRRDLVRTFSQGMAKRANLARSLLHDPDLWLLDEPFSALDPPGRELLCALVRELRARGGAVLLVTHQVEAGIELASRVLRLEGGVLRAPEGPSP